jgi:ABC-type long-subunit fatty acid transport system fused permease/ATPase subunit
MGWKHVERYFIFSLLLNLSKSYIDIWKRVSYKYNKHFKHYLVYNICKYVKKTLVIVIEEIIIIPFLPKGMHLGLTRGTPLFLLN